MKEIPAHVSLAWDVGTRVEVYWDPGLFREVREPRRSSDLTTVDPKQDLFSDMQEAQRGCSRLSRFAALEDYNPAFNPGHREL